MSEIAELRKLFQDLIAPDLKAIKVKQESMEKSMNDRFSASDAIAEARHAVVLAKFEMIEKMLDLDRRLQRVEERENSTRPAA